MMGGRPGPDSVDPREAAFEIFEPSDALGANVILEGRITSVGRGREVRGLGKTFYSANVVTYPGTRSFRNVPILSPYLFGSHGIHIGVQEGAHVVLGLFGKEEQAIILGFFSPLVGDDTFSGTGKGRPKLGPGDIMMTSLGQGLGKGSGIRYLSGTGFILDQAASDCIRTMDPHTGSIEDFCRNYGLIVPAGFVRWTEEGRRSRKALYHGRIFERAKNSPDGPGAFVDFQVGTVPKKTTAGSVKDAADTLLALLDVNGNLEFQFDEAGNFVAISAGDVTLDMTRAGDTSAKITGTVSSLTTPIDGQELTIAVNGITFTFTIFSTLTSLATIVREIDTQVPEVIADLDATTDVITVESKEKGASVSLTISGEAAVTLGIAGIAVGTAGTGSNQQDLAATVGGKVTLSIGTKKGSRRAFEFEVKSDGTLKMDADGTAVLTLDLVLQQAVLDVGDGKAKATFKNDGTVETECVTFKVTATQEVELDAPKFKFGLNVADRLVKSAAFTTAMNTRLAIIRAHTHSAFGTPSVEIVAAVDFLSSEFETTTIQVDQ